MIQLSQFRFDDLVRTSDQFNQVPRWLQSCAYAYTQSTSAPVANANASDTADAKEVRKASGVDETFETRLSRSVLLSNRLSEPQNFEEALLLRCFEQGGVMTNLFDSDHDSRLDMSVFAVRKGSTGRRTGEVMSLRLWRMTVAPDQFDAPRFVRSPGSYLLPCDRDFTDQLSRIESSFEHTLRNAPPVCLVWDISPLADDAILLGVKGASFGAAFALSAYRLLRDSIADPVVKARLSDSDPRAIGVTAQIHGRSGRPQLSHTAWPLLESIDGVEQKWLASAGWGDAMAEKRRVIPTKLLVAHAQANQSNDEHGIEPLSKCPGANLASLAELFQRASELTGERLAAQTQALLFALLRDDATPPSLIDATVDELSSDHSPRGLLGYLLHRYALRASGRHVAFTLPGITDVQSAAASAIKILISPTGGVKSRARDAGPLPSIEGLLSLPDQPSAWVLTAGPGAGKTFLLADFEKRMALAAIHARCSGALSHQEPLWVPAWLSLSRLDVSDGNFDAQLTKLWQEQYPCYPLAKFMDDVERAGLRWVLLLDAINESMGDYTQRKTAMSRIAQWIHNQRQRFGSTQFVSVFSVRSLEQVPVESQLVGFRAEQATLAQWSIQDAVQYIEKRLLGTTQHGATAADLIAQLQRPHSEGQRNFLADLSQTPSLVAAQCALIESGLVRQAIDNKAKLFAALAVAMLVQEHRKHRLAPPLFSEHDLRLLDTPHELLSGNWPHLPDDGTCIGYAEKLAESMQQQGMRQIEAPWRTAGESLFADKTAHDAWLTTMTGVGWGHRAGQSTNPIFRWAHEQWREYFAARIFRFDTTTLKQLTTRPLIPPTEREFITYLTYRAAKMAVWQQPVSEFEESVKLSLQAAATPQAIASALQTLMPINLALAARCATTVRYRLESDEDAAWRNTAHPVLQTLRAQLCQASESPVADSRRRVEYGELLGMLGGDPRFELRELSDNGQLVRYLILKDAHWRQIGLAGKKNFYTIGKKKGGKGALGHEFQVQLDAFRLAAHPVTNQEYAYFLRAGGYTDMRNWPRLDQRVWLNEPDRSQRRPYSLSEGQRTLGLGTQPITGVTWFEARAYCEWLGRNETLRGRANRPTDVTKPRRFCLPTEAHHEAAARGTDGRCWPHIPAHFEWQNPSAVEINFNETQLDKTSAIGVFPNGQSRDGVFDLAGNVRQWMDNSYTNSPEEPEITRTARDSEDIDKWIAVRAGYFAYGPLDCRGWSREGERANSHDAWCNYTGFRLMLDL